MLRKLLISIAIFTFTPFGSFAMDGVYVGCFGGPPMPGPAQELPSIIGQWGADADAGNAEAEVIFGGDVSYDNNGMNYPSPCPRLIPEPEPSPPIDDEVHVVGCFGAYQLDPGCPVGVPGDPAYDAVSAEKGNASATDAGCFGGPPMPGTAPPNYADMSSGRDAESAELGVDDFANIALEHKLPWPPPKPTKVSYDNNGRCFPWPVPEPEPIPEHDIPIPDPKYPMEDLYPEEQPEDCILPDRNAGNGNAAGSWFHDTRPLYDIECVAGEKNPWENWDWIRPGNDVLKCLTPEQEECLFDMTMADYYRRHGTEIDGVCYDKCLTPEQYEAILCPLYHRYGKPDSLSSSCMGGHGGSWNGIEPNPEEEVFSQCAIPGNSGPIVMPWVPADQSEDIICTISGHGPTGPAGIWGGQGPWEVPTPEKPPGQEPIRISNDIPGCIIGVLDTTYVVRKACFPSWKEEASLRVVGLQVNMPTDVEVSYPPLPPYMWANTVELNVHSAELGPYGRGSYGDGCSCV